MFIFSEIIEVVEEKEKKSPRKKIRNDITYTISKNIRNALGNICKDLKRSENSKSTILLSPAAASFDQFNNFENRGIYFRNLVIKKFKKR